MLRILVTRQSRYPLDSKALKKRVVATLTEHAVSSAEVSIAIVGTRKMKDLAVAYLGEKEDDQVHEVLSFPFSETKGDLGKNNFISSPQESLQLGDIIICYPEARKIAMKRNRMVDDVLGELAEHGALHLLGIHHG